MNTNKGLADRYLKWVADNYNYLYYKYFNFCKSKHYDFDEDIFCETYLKIYESIIKRGLKDESEQGFENYTFKAFRNNIMVEKVYCRNKNRDSNINSDNINDLYEKYYNSHNISSREKLINGLFKDFAILYIMTKVEDNFDAERFYLFRIKTLVPNMTYAKLQETTKIEQSRKKTIEVMRYVKENITKEEIRNAFVKIYGDLIEE